MSQQSQQSLSNSALLVIDVQKGFGSKGELPVPDAESIVPVINKLIPKFPIVVATKDWHPKEHVSFASTHGKNPGDTLKIGELNQPLFTAHCVADTPGADFIDGIDHDSFAKVFLKGTQSSVDSFSAFIDNAGGKATDIAEFLREKDVRQIFIVGLATNYCVSSSAIDAVNSGFNVTVITDACRGIDEPPGAVQKSLQAMEAAGIKLIESSELA